MVAVLVAVSMATSLTPSAAFANKNAEVPLLASQRLLLPPMQFRAMWMQAIPKLERTTRPMSKAPVLRVMPVLRATLRPFPGALVDEMPSGDSSNAEEVNSKRPPLWLRFPRTRAMQTLLLPLLPRRFPARPRSSSRTPRIRTTRIPRSRGRSRLATKLWANMYDEVETEDDWGETTTETQSVRNPGPWTYTWLCRHG